ncbi:MAG: acyltransferase family protein [Spirochaetales bacterium]|nr:acyltransferase family protein [Spirochaetales bacterium]
MNLPIDENKKDRPRVLWADILRIIACFSVILLHSVAELLYKYKELKPDYWMAANFWDSLTRFCVPVFVMLSGYFLLGTRSELKPLPFFKKRILKILMPFLVWAAIYYCWRIFYWGAE